MTEVKKRIATVFAVIAFLIVAPLLYTTMSFEDAGWVVSKKDSAADSAGGWLLSNKDSAADSAGWVTSSLNEVEDGEFGHEEEEVVPVHHGRVLKGGRGGRGGGSVNTYSRATTSPGGSGTAQGPAVSKAHTNTQISSLVQIVSVASVLVLVFIV